MKKTNKFISMLLVLAMLLSMAPLTVLAADNLTDTTTSVTLKDADGDGLYEIGTAADLYAFANLVNAGNTSISVELTADITLNENVLKEDGTLNGDGSNFTPWVPIGGAENKFAGVFDGKKHTISGLYYNGTDTYVGLFGSVDGKYQSDTIGVIKNIAIVDSYLKTTISGYNIWVRVGGVAGFANSHSHFQNCFVEATIEVDNSSDCKLCIGGIAGMTYTNAVNCCTDVIINYNDDAIVKDICGILGSVTNGSIINCHTNYSILGEYNSGTEVTDCSTNVTDEQFASGEITYLLNGSKAEPGSVWKQTLGEDEYPSFNGKYVFYDDTKGYYNPAHTHSFEYSANGDTITAVCTAEFCFLTGCNGGTLKISAPADIYADGTTAKEATVENNLVDTSVTYEVTYSTADGNAPSTAGTNTASVTVGGATATVEFTLLNYAAKVTDKDGNAVGTYKTFADAITAAQDSEGSTVTLLDDVTLSSTQYIYSGKFTLDLNGKTLLNESKQTIRLQPDADVTIKDSGEGGTIQTNGETAQAILSYGTLTVESGVIKGDGGIFNVGTLTFKNGRAESHNYYAIDNFGTAYIYNGTFKAVSSAAIKNSSDSTVYVYGGEFSGSAGIVNYGTAFIEGGEFTGNSYVALNLLGGTVEVTGGSFTGTDFASGYYSGTPYGEYTVYCNEGATLTLKGGEFPNGFVVDETTANTFLAEGYYYKDADGKLIDVADDAKIINGYVKVSKGADLADAVITVDETELVYNGTEHKPAVTVTVGGKTLDSSNYTVAYESNINAGTATVTVTAVEGGNYTGKATAQFTINKADSSATAPTANELTYNGSAQELISAGSSDDGKMQYSLDGVTYSAEIPTGTDAGKYTVYYKIIGDANHNDSEPATVSVTINTKDISDAFIILGDTLTYNGTEQTQTVEKVLPTGTAPEATYTVSGNKATNVGVYLLTVTGTGNFSGEAKIAYEIALDDECISHLDRVEDNGVMKWNVKSTDRASLEYVIDQLNNAVTDIADADTKNEWADTKEACEDMLRIINSIELAIADVEEDYAGFSKDTVKSSDIPALDEIVSKVNEIKDRYGFNLTDEEAKKLEDILDGIEKLKAKIAETAEEIERIDEAVNGYDKETVKSSDVPELGKLIDDIKALTDGDNLTEDEKIALEENDKAIDNLIEKLTEVAEEIKRVDEAVKSYDEDSVKSTDSEDLAQLKEDIQALIDSDNTTENEKTALGEMIKGIEALEEKVEETENQLEEIKGIENNYNPETVSSDDKAAIKEAIAEIEAVNPDNLTDEQKAEYEEIKAGFEALLDEIAAAEKDVADIGVELDMFDEERVTKFWEDDIEALKAKIDELLADENMGEAEKAKLNEYKAQAEKLIEIINTPKEYFSLRFFYLIWDCLNWKYNGILWLFSKIFSC